MISLVRVMKPTVTMPHFSHMAQAGNPFKYFGVHLKAGIAAHICRLFYRSPIDATVILPLFSVSHQPIPAHGETSR